MKRLLLGVVLGWVVGNRVRRDVEVSRRAYDQRVEWELQKIIEDARR